MPSGLFQSTRPRGARRAVCCRICRDSRPRGARRKASCQTDQHNSFNPRARVGRDGVLGPDCNCLCAPAWGATCYDGIRPAAGRRPRGARRHLTQSTHHCRAPAWGATIWALRIRPEHQFQSTRPRGARRDDQMYPPYSALFQSTRPRGARRPGYCFHAQRRTRARVGRDDGITHMGPPDINVSIHAPAWGATIKH